MRRLTLAGPFLFGAFPIVSLFASNVNLVRPAEILLPLGIALGTTGLLLLFGTLALRDSDAAAVVVSLFWILFAWYGRVLHAIGGAGAGRDRGLLILWALLFVAGGYAAIRWRGRLRDGASILAAVGAVLVAMPLLTMAPGLVAQARAARGDRTAVLALRPELAPAPQEATATPAPPLATPTPGQPLAGSASPTPEPSPTTRPSSKPDIYYIILDGYGRSDVLQDRYRFDNSQFLAWLAAKGFYVATGSRANYAQTYLSLASSLNCGYLDQAAERIGLDSVDRRPLQGMVKDNAVVDLLRQQGYTYVAVSTGYAEAELSSADVYLRAPWSLSQFEAGLLNTTPISPVIALQYGLHRDRLLYAFDHLPDAAAMKGPVFVLAHIMAPHPPFVFGAQGERLTPDREFTVGDGDMFMERVDMAEYVAGYTGQLVFTNAKVQAVVEAILARSPEPPVIILQGDHGPGSGLHWFSAQRTDLEERMSILNAYYLPGVGKAGLYEDITPVNTFRLILNLYFGAGYELLPDRSYFSTWDHPYRFLSVDEQGHLVP